MTTHGDRLRQIEAREEAERQRREADAREEARMTIKAQRRETEKVLQQIRQQIGVDLEAGKRPGPYRVTNKLAGKFHADNDPNNDLFGEFCTWAKSEGLKVEAKMERGMQGGGMHNAELVIHVSLLP